MKTSLLALIASSALLLGCEQTHLFASERSDESTAIAESNRQASQPTKPQRAVVEAITPTMKAEIQQAIVSLKGGVPPLLSDTVFVRSSELLLEHGRTGADLGRPILGAHNLPVQGFRLQKRDIGCVLYHPQSKKYVLLKTVPCQVEELK